jgi:hypothetical protein
VTPRPTLAGDTRLPPPIVDWRRRSLVGAGFATGLAEQLALDGDVDLHAVLELIDRGCPPELAARIVFPLDKPWRS